MPADAADQLRMTAAEYLAWEREQPERHEFLHGEVFSMAGGTPRHNALVAAVTIELGVRVRGGPSRVLATDQRIVARDNEHYVYADASVVCGRMELAAGTNDVFANPTIIVEVLSKNTEAYDRGKKWDGYQNLASVADYLLVAQTTARVEHFQRGADGEWKYRVAGAGGRVSLSNGAVLDVDAIYAGAFELDGD
jgi:Uma2 family endonuclease